METRTPPVSHSIQEVANLLRNVGWIDFWVQLILAVVAGLSLLFALSGRNFVEQASQGLGIGIFWAICGIIVVLYNAFVAFRYTRMSKALRKSNPDARPRKADTISLIKLGLVASLIGLLLNLLGAGATCGVLVAKVVSQPPGVAITDPSRIVRALDIFVAIANLNGITAHYISSVASLWVLDRVYRH